MLHSVQITRASASVAAAGITGAHDAEPEATQEHSSDYPEDFTPLSEEEILAEFDAMEEWEDDDDDEEGYEETEKT